MTCSIIQQLHQYRQRLLGLTYFSITSKILGITGPILLVKSPLATLGEVVSIQQRGQDNSEYVMRAEVVGLSAKMVNLLPFGDVQGISLSHEACFQKTTHRIAVGKHCLGKIFNGLGESFNNAADLQTHAQTTVEKQTVYLPLMAPAPDALSREPVENFLVTGVRALDALLTIGIGQRLGLFAAAGMGKTSLLTMLLRGTQADVVVLALVGERGREVNEFLMHLLPEYRQKCVVVVATSDRPPIERMKAALVATTMAEYFRSQGKCVLLLVDSLTRLARAQREIGLACGEPATRRGFPSSVFTLFSQLLERAGNDAIGSITAIYTVLVEGDDHNEPVADEARSLLDGHVILSAKLAGAGHFPAIDINRSISRVMTQIVSPDHMQSALHLRRLLAKYDDIELLVNIGEYEQGHDALGDEALAKIALIQDFLRQDMAQWSSPEATLAALHEITTS